LQYIKDQTGTTTKGPAGTVTNRGTVTYLQVGGGTVTIERDSYEHEETRSVLVIMASSKMSVKWTVTNSGTVTK
jgi:hypothetical protein